MRRFSKALAILLSVLFLISTAPAKPRIKVANDGFPTGQNTPEGAASDLARSFIEHNGAWFRSLCIRPYNAGQSRADYIDYLDGVVDHMKQEKVFPAKDSPQRVQVFAARHLSKNGPASYAYAAFDFQDVMFVDVKVKLTNGETLLRRTMVIKDHDSDWYALPVPDISPLMSDGIYDEKASVQPFTAVYDVIQK